MSQPTDRSFAPLTDEHPARLSALAAQDREQFYASSPRYRGRHLATVLAQGAAQHFIDGMTGVKDLDVWSFFALPAGEDKFPADIRHRHVDFGPSTLGRQLYDLSRARSKVERARWVKWARFEGRRVDLFLRGQRCGIDTDPVDAITEWLRAGRSKKNSSPWWLSQKAVVLLDPWPKEIVWPPDRAGGQRVATSPMISASSLGRDHIGQWLVGRST